MTKLGALATMLAVGFMRNEVSATQVLREGYVSQHLRDMEKLGEIKRENLLWAGATYLGLTPIAEARVTMACLLNRAWAAIDDCGEGMMLVAEEPRCSGDSTV